MVKIQFGRSLLIQSVFYMEVSFWGRYAYTRKVLQKTFTVLSGIEYTQLLSLVIIVTEIVQLLVCPGKLSFPFGLLRSPSCNNLTRKHLLFIFGLQSSHLYPLYIVLLVTLKFRQSYLVMLLPFLLLPKAIIERGAISHVSYLRNLGFSSSGRQTN